MWITRHSPAPAPELPPRVRGYLDAIAQACGQEAPGLVSLILFGSAVRGGFHAQVSDVDLIAVLPDDAADALRERRAQMRDLVSRLETEHDVRSPSDPAKAQNPLEAFAERAVGEDRSCFVCTRSDLLSGDVARVFALQPAEAFFVDRIVFANVIASAGTVWGEDLLGNVHPPPVRRLDVAKAWFAFTSQVGMSLAAYPLLPRATHYAMAALKHSLHSCYFCYHGETTNLGDEVNFFQQRLGDGRTSETLRLLQDLRARYRKSFAFALRCMPALLRLHFRTARENRFPLRTAQ